MSVVVFDLAGVLIDAAKGKREYEIQREKDSTKADKDYEQGLFAHFDTAISDSVQIVNSLVKEGYKIVFLTGRRESSYEHTKKRLAEIGFPVRDIPLYMKTTKKMNTYLYKKDVLRVLGNVYDIVAFVDDKADNREAGIELGIPVFERVEELLFLLEECYCG